MKSAKITIILRVPNKINRSTENERFRCWQGRRSSQCIALSMQPDAVQRRNKPFECRFILLCALSLFTMLSSCQGSIMTGLDCVDSYSQMFQGKRIGIITNHTAYNSNGEYIVDVIIDMPDVKVTALFGPEHGLWGKEQDAIKIDNQIDPAS
ncbi:MAG: exo-beta-N-acetylmuramidase NamZ domain-containing protein, partial [Planctomycetota bacterium]